MTNSQNMDIQNYQQIYLYLKEQTLPTTLTTMKQQQKFKNYCSQFQLKNNFIYKKDRKNNTNLLRVIRIHEIEPVLFMMHDDPTTGYFAVDKMFEKLKEDTFGLKCMKPLDNTFNLVINAKGEAKIKTNNICTQYRHIVLFIK